MGETFQRQKMQVGKPNCPLHKGGCQAVLFKVLVFVVLRQSPDLEWEGPERRSALPPIFHQI